IARAMHMREKWGWIALVIIPLMLLVKNAFNSTTVYLSSVLTNVNVRFGGIFDICLKSELVFLLPLVVKIAILVIIRHPSTLEDTNIMPMSLYSLVPHGRVPLWANYPLQLVNVFEAAYIGILSRLYSVKFGLPFARSLTIAGGGYVLGLIFWVL